MQFKRLAEKFSNRHYITNDDWYNGYSRTECAIKVTMNPYSLEVATAGNWIQFADGSKRELLIFQMTEPIS